MNFTKIVFVIALLAAERGPWYLIGRHPSTETSLVSASQLIYDGAFRIPSGTDAAFGFCTCAIAFDPNGNSGAGSLFVGTYNNNANWGGVSEISIPTPIISGTLSALNRATNLQSDTDATEGTLYLSRTAGFGSSSSIIGLLVKGTTLYINAAAYYDADGTQSASFYKRSKNLSLISNVTGPFSTTLAKQGYTAGYMADIPSERQGVFAGDTLAGLWSLPIVTRESTGVSAFSFNASAIGASPMTPSALLFYPSNHPLGVTYGTIMDGDVNLLFNPTSPVGEGAVIIPGKRSILFFGGMGTGPWCYGEGTTNPALDHTIAPDGGLYCYDLEENAKGGHAYPYKAYFWFYDLNDLISVKNGDIQSYTPQPYEYGNLANYISTFDALYGGKPAIQGVAYDAINRRIYLSAQKQDSAGPVFHRFHLN